MLDLPANAGYSKCQSNFDRNISPYCFKRGDRGTQVQKVSELLREIGYYQGSATKQFNGNLEKAVITFQKDYRLQVSDGVVGNETLLHICKVRGKGCKPNDDPSCYTGSPRMVTSCLSDFKVGVGKNQSDSCF